MSVAKENQDARLALDVAGATAEDEAWLWIRALVTTVAAWIAWVFGLGWFVAVGHHVFDRVPLMIACLVVIFVYLSARMYLVVSHSGSIQTLWAAFLVADFSSLGFSVAISGGSSSPFLPVMFIMPIVGALVYGAIGGLSSGLLSALTTALACAVAHRFLGGVLDPWVVGGNVIWLITLGIAAGLMASKQRADAVAGALARLRIARVESRVSEARARLDDALSGFEGQVSGRLAESLAEVRSASESLAASDSELHGLTPREFEVLELMARGMSHAAIAAELFISVRTVKDHATHIYQKLGVTCRHEAIVTAHARRLVEVGAGKEG